MQFNFAFVVAALASIAAAETVTVYACGPTGGAPAPSAGPYKPAPIASTGVYTPPAPTATTVPFTGAGSVNRISGAAAIAAGALALFL